MTLRKILVTGAAGFIGYHLCVRLLDEGYTVVGIDNINDYYDTNLKFDRLSLLGIKRIEAEEFGKETKSSSYGNFRFLRAHLQDKELLENLFETEKFDAVIHLAAQAGVRYSLQNPDAYINSNIVGFLNILEGCRHNNVMHLVYASSSSVYGANSKTPFSESDPTDSPVSLYAATKKSNELMAHTYSHLYRIPTSGLRFFTVYGPWGRPDMSPHLFADAISKDKPINVFNDGEMHRDFTYIDDIINGVIITLENPPTNKELPIPYQIFNIGNGQSVYLKKFIELIEEALSKQATINYMPMQAGDVVRTWADTSLLNALGYKSSIGIEEGVEKFIEWFKNYYNQSTNRV